MILRWALPLALMLLCSDALAARIDGRVIHPTRPGAAAGLAVHLLGVTRDAETLQRETQSDANGRFSFDGLGVSAVYLVMADYGGIRFPGGREVFQANEADAVRSLTFHIYERTADASALQVTSQRFFVQRGEAGTYRVTQTVAAHNPLDRVVVIADDASAGIRVSLFAKHGAIETRFGGLPDGTRVRDDELELRGPFFPGDEELSVSYEVDAGGRDFRGTLALPSGASELELWVRDEGVEIDAGPLHPARAGRLQDGFYQRYLGFDLLPGTEIPLSIVARPKPGPGALWPQVALAVVLSLGLAWVVGEPLTRSAGVTAEPEERAAAHEKQALFTALRDLEHDYETDKLSLEDHDRLRDELRADALRALARLEQPAPEREQLAPEDRVCSCGRRAAPDDRFCASCGSPL